MLFPFCFVYANAKKKFDIVCIQVCIFDTVKLLSVKQMLNVVVLTLILLKFVHVSQFYARTLKRQTRHLYIKE